MRYRCRLLVLLIVSACSLLLFAASGDGAWLRKVPPAQRDRNNPLAEDPRAAAAGEKLFEENCSKCHGKDAEGKGRKPALRSDRVRGASPGELEWLLTNGSLRNGMPSWSRLPEQQRWQLVAFLKSLR